MTHVTLAAFLGGWEIILILLTLLPLAIVGTAVFLILHFSRKPSNPSPPSASPVIPSTEIIPRKCPQCGAELKADVSEGLCPACLLQRGIATEGGAPPGTPPFVPPTIPDLAKLFPQLEIIELIGQGGMGAVYKARQPALDRFVALKILSPRSGNDLDFASRFTREARALAKLTHPNIVGVYDFGAMSGLNYFIMEYVDGPNLRQLEQAGKLSSREALEIIPQICAALQFAHDEGIVHRDIKPENILLDKKGRVKIADFGLAKILGQEPKDFRLTGARDIMGTPHYMAPEQVEKPQTVDHRADIYSLGVVFYEMLTGELPLGKFRPPSQKVQVDVRLDEVVLRSLAKEPELRYQHVSEVKTRVETIASTDAPAAAPTISTDELLARDYSLNIRNCLRRGWALVRNDFWPLVGMSAFVLVAMSAAASFELVLSSGKSAGYPQGKTSILGLLLTGPLFGGLYLYFLKKIRGETASVETAFTGFRQPFPHLVVGSFLAGLLTALGFVCLIIPGIYLLVAWMLVIPLIVDRRLEFWPAMQLSRRLVTKHWWKFLGFLIVLGLINLAGILACGVGLFITFPVTFAALAYAYEEITGAVRSPAGASPPIPPTPQPDRFWRRFAVVMACVISIPIVIAIIGLLAAIAIPNFVRARQQAQQNAAQQWTQEGWQLWRDQKLDQAAAKFRQATQLVPSDADAWNGLGWATFNAGKPQEAESAFQKAISLDTNQPGALNGLGQIYLSQRKFDQAETYLLKAAPAAPAAWHGLTRLYLLEGKFEQAESWAQKVVDSGQADDLARQMLKAAQEKHLSEALRSRIEPPPANQAGNTPAGSPMTNIVPASAETWSPTLAPGEKPDVDKIRQEAQELTGKGQYEEALQRHIWYHNHALQYGTGQTGVRLSFALADWVELGRRYPKAKQALIEIRDRDTRDFAEGQGYFDLFMDVHSLNQYLGDDEATYSLFKRIEPSDPPLARQCFGVIEDLLVSHGEYDLCLGYIGDPQTAFESIRQSREQLKALEDQWAARRQEQTKRFEEMAKTNSHSANTPDPFLPEPPRLADKKFVGQTRQLIEILVGANRKTDAGKIREEALGVLNVPELQSAVSDAEAQIQKVRATSGHSSAQNTGVTENPRGVKLRYEQVLASNPAPAKTLAETNDLTGAATKAWHAHVEQLRQRLEQNPQAGIPELKFLTEYDWLEAAKDELKTDADYRRALNHLRVAGETHFVDSQLQPALKIYVQVNHGQFPANLAQLQPFFQPPVDEAILQRYEIVPHEKVPDAHWGGDWVVTQKSPVDKDYDRRLVVGAEGGWGRIPF